MNVLLDVLAVLMICLCFATAAAARDSRLPVGAWARYELLSTVEGKAPPVEEVTLTLGPHEKVAGRELQWWEFAARKSTGEQFAARFLSESVPMVAGADAPGQIRRYIFVDGADRPIEYVDARSGEALLPKFEFPSGLLPAPMPRSRLEGGFAVTGSCLGQVITLAETGSGRDWMKWPNPVVLNMSPDELHYMYGLARDTEGRYISEGDYTYVQLTREELYELIDRGLNSFNVDDKYEEWVKDKPVFYYRSFEGESKLSYPEVLYRSNFRGAVMFIDEPAIRVLHDRADLDKLRRPDDGGYLMTKRLEEFWNQPGSWRRTWLRDQLRARGVNLGTLQLDDNDHPIWETIIETSFYQLQGGASGVVQECRFQLKDYIANCELFLGRGLELTVNDMLRVQYAYMRGAARQFGKDWGVAIYGQCDPEIAPVALATAYDMGARYMWFWTYDHQHHLPHFMKLKLLDALKEHKAAHPRKPIRELRNAKRTAIVWPYGYGYTLEFYNLWDSKNLYVHYRNAAGVPHSDVIAAGIAEAIACAKSDEDFDFLVDIGQDFKGYGRVVKIGLDGTVRDSAGTAAHTELPAAKVKVEAHQPTKAPAGVQLVRIPYKHAIDINGDLSEWQGAEWVTMDQASRYVGCQLAAEKSGEWGGAHDLSASFAFARDEDFLYVAARVRDDKHVQDQDGPAIWKGDSIQIALDPKLDRTKGAYSHDDIEFGLALTERGPEAYLWKGGEDVDAGPVKDVRVAVSRAGEETIYEAALPWNSLTSLPALLVGDCGISFLVNDNDGDGRKGFLQLTPGIGERKDPSSFAYARMDPMSAEQAASYATLLGGYRIANDARKWTIPIEAAAASAKTAQLDVTLQRGGRKAATGSFKIEMPKGLSLIEVTTDVGALRPGAYRCRALLRSGKRVLLDRSFVLSLFR